MRVGTKSLFFGAHQFIIHPLIVAFCYIKLYGWTWDWRVWLCFILHDIGYYGKLNMDGNDDNGGAWHPIWAYKFFMDLGMKQTALYCLYHSRFMTMNFVKVSDYNTISKLGVADKLAVTYTPLFMYTKSELLEYTKNEDIDDKYMWKDVVNKKCLKFVQTWKDDAYDIQQY